MDSGHSYNNNTEKHKYGYKIIEWKTAVTEKMGALAKNDMWDLFAVPKGHKTVGCKLVLHS